MIVSYTAPRISESELREEEANMTTQEKAAAIRDVYGLGEEDAVLETPEFMRAKFAEMERVAASMVTRTTKKAITNHAYNLALEQCPDRADSIRLMFIRAQQYDSTAAATDMVRYWSMALELFGRERAFLPRITLADLSTEDHEALYESSFMILPSVDEHGRRIMLSNRVEWRYKHRLNMLRAIWYVLHAYLEEENLQRKGLTSIMCDVGCFEFQDIDQKLDAAAIRVLRAMPIQYRAFHQITNSSIVRMGLPINLHVMGKKFRQRFVPHQDLTTWHRSFREYGLPVESLPPRVGGALHYDHRVWLNERKAQGL